MSGYTLSLVPPSEVVYPASLLVTHLELNICCCCIVVDFGFGKVCSNSLARSVTASSWIWPMGMNIVAVVGLVS